MYGCQDTSAHFPRAPIPPHNAFVYSSTLRENLQAVMDSRGLSATRLSAITGVPQPTISRFLNGSTDAMELATLMPLAQALGVTTSQLIGETPLEPTAARRRLHTLAQNVPEYKVPTAVKILDALVESDEPLVGNGNS